MAGRQNKVAAKRPPPARGALSSRSLPHVLNLSDFLLDGFVAGRTGQPEICEIKHLL